ncbi:MAG: hypothetical protein ACOZNI_28015 [Myxococcota bacterium]
MSTALQKVIAGEKPADSKKTGLLNEAVDKIKSLGGRIERAKEVTESIAEAMIATAETQGTVFAASFAEGYLGEEKMDLGPVDLRIGGGLVVGGYGLYQAMNGKGGSHALAIGNGLLAAGVGRIGRHAGRALADKKNAPATPPATTPAPAAAPAPGAAPATAGVPAARQIAADDIGEIARMVRMTPGTEGDDDVAGRRRRRKQRFIRARRDREEDDE